MDPTPPPARLITFPYTPGGPFSPDAHIRWRCGMGTTGEVVCEMRADRSIIRVVKFPCTDLPTLLADNRKLMLREMEIYSRLDTNPHPFVLRSLGADRANYALYLPHCMYGDLARCLQLHPKLLTPQRKLKWCYQLASAVEHLHSLKIYHCDLDLGNILVDTDGNLQVCDFAGSSMDYSTPTRLARARYTIRDYHVKTEREWSVHDLKQIDVFAMASLFYHLHTGHAPYAEIHDEKKVLDLYTRSRFPDTRGMPLGNLIRDIWTEKTTSVEEIIWRIIVEIPLPS